jgi:hypothetical protein
MPRNRYLNDLNTPISNVLRCQVLKTALSGDNILIHIVLVIGMLHKTKMFLKYVFLQINFFVYSKIQTRNI